MTSTFRSKTRTGRLILLLFTGLLSLALLVSGCGTRPDTKPGGDPAAGETGRPPISSEPAESTVTVTLYFSDAQAMYLEREEREVVKGNETLEELVIAELMKGPAERESGSPIPEGTKLLGVSVVDGVAYVNFSEEFRSKHWGGSTGESHTVYAIVNSLCELEGIEKVQFLLEGDPLDTLGHMELTEPVAPNPDMVQ